VAYMTWWAASRPTLPKKCLVTLGCPARGLVTSFLFLRYRLRSFKLGVEILDPYGMIVVIS
jgi:hypothetical protein